MKILIVTDAWHPQVNGVVRTYEYLQSELEDMGHTVKVIGPSDFPKSYPMPGYAEIRLVLFPYQRLAQMIETFDADILHIGTEGPLGLAARKYALKNGIRFTSCYHTNFPDYAAKRAAKLIPILETPVRNIGISFVRYFHAPSSCLFVATPSMEETLKTWGFTPSIKQMTRGIDHGVFHTGPKTLFHDLKKPVALYVGRIAIEKNIESFLSIPWEGTKAIVGHGPDLEHLKQKYPDAVFTGIKTGNDLADHYRSADVFVFPSRTDTFGMVLVEAMACGLPIAAYPVTGPIDIVTQDYLGSLQDDLSAAAHTALSCGTPEQRERHAKAYYNWHTVANQFLEKKESQ